MSVGSQPLRIGIMGGTFDPIHHGHLVAASEVQNVFGLAGGCGWLALLDIDRGGTTYTSDTLHDIAAEYPGAELYFITGADALAQILTWKDNEEIFGLAHLVGVTRPGHALTDGGLPADRVSLVEVPAMAISSTDCRERVGRGASVWYLVPDGVVQYIRKYGLYRVTQRQASTTSMTARVAREQSLRKENDGE